ncbi:MAG: hypothetical protein HY908_34430 [Myxococcales bacterium]|nr:hypothetical protein [Myxococcales bacterium]
MTLGLRAASAATVVALALGAAGCEDEDSDYVPPEVCASGDVAPDLEESPLMRPGGDCIGCHAADEGPSYDLAGTVMVGADDDTNCNGVGGIAVEITDAHGAVLTLATNAAGNFFHELQAGAVALPYTARVLYQGRVRAMASAQTEGSCNTCHSDTGAPGRILVP